MSNIYESLDNVEKQKLKRDGLADKFKFGKDLKKSLDKIKNLKSGKLNLIPMMIFLLAFVILIIVNMQSYNQQKQNALSIEQAFLKFQEIENSIDYTNEQVSIISNDFSNFESNFESVKTNLDKIVRITDVSSSTLVKFD